jgi:hypothetical protein
VLDVDWVRRGSRSEGRRVVRDATIVVTVYKGVGTAALATALAAALVT